MDRGHSYCFAKFCRFSDSGFRAKAPELGNSVVDAKECSVKAPPLQKAQGWATQVQRQRVPQAATYNAR